MINGVREGEWRYYYPGGTLNAIHPLRQGMLHGTAYYYPDGRPESVEQWQNGTMQDSAWYYHQDGGLYRKGMFNPKKSLDFFALRADN